MRNTISIRKSRLMTPLRWVMLSSLLAATAIAHHSMAMFDKNRTISIAGTLYAVEWKSPHSWVWITVQNDQGEAEQWGLECGSPAALTRLGFSKKDLTVGTKVTAELYPLKDERSGGSLVKLSFADGRVWGK